MNRTDGMKQTSPWPKYRYICFASAVTGLLWAIRADATLHVPHEMRGVGPPHLGMLMISPRSDELRLAAHDVIGGAGREGDQGDMGDRGGTLRCCTVRLKLWHPGCLDFAEGNFSGGDSLKPSRQNACRGYTFCYKGAQEIVIDLASADPRGFRHSLFPSSVIL